MRMPMTNFVLVCLIWGTTWLAMKLGIARVPPIFFGGTRFTVAGIVLLGCVLARGGSLRPLREDMARLSVVTALILVLTYALLFWGMLYTASGLAAVLEMSLIPISLALFGVLLGEDRMTASRAGAMGIGLAGLVILFAPKLTVPDRMIEVWGAAAIAISAVTYSLGSVLARPLLHRHSAVLVSGVTTLVGGLVLTVGALALEPGALAAADLRWGAAAWGGWLFLVMGGSLIAYTAYLALILEWGPARAGSYAYISPVIAVVVGVVILHEHVTAQDAVGMLLLLGAAFLSLWKPR